MKPLAIGWGTIRVRLLAGFAAILLLLAAAGIVGRLSLTSLSERIANSLASVRRESQLTAAITASASQELAAGARYLEQPDSATENAFRDFGRKTHQAQRELNASPGMESADISLIAAIDQQLSKLENELAAAHRLKDLHRDAEAIAAASVRPLEAALLADLRQLGQRRARQMDLTAAALHADAQQRSGILLSVIFGAMLLGVLIVVSTIRSIVGPLGQLRAQARALSTGRLDVRTTVEMPGEFQELATTMNSTSDWLARVVNIATRTADEVSMSAHELASAADQISMAAGQTATAMSGVTEGATEQAMALRSVDDSLHVMRGRADAVRTGASEVRVLAEGIEHSAREKRVEVDRSLGILKDVRLSVERAAAEVRQLDTTAVSINRFVATVSRIAEQTNLLALNAAIEAARAGVAGRGFAVVADEVRKLAEQAQAAADDVVQLTGAVTASVASTAQAMHASSARVGEIEKLSHDIDAALSDITRAAERTLIAASDVTVAADENVTAVLDASSGISQAARTAESHAAAAEQVSASTQEQSAACEQMSAASATLLAGASRLKEIVSELRATG